MPENPTNKVQPALPESRSATHQDGTKGSGPPGGGRQDHEVMRVAAMRPVTGPAGTDTLAAGGGLDLPGREAHPEFADPGAASPSPVGSAPSYASAPEPIPGEHDRSTITHREPGAVSGQFAGADIPEGDLSGLMDEQTRRDRMIEGGGKVNRKRR